MDCSWLGTHQISHLVQLSGVGIRKKGSVKQRDGGGGGGGCRGVGEGLF